MGRVLNGVARYLGRAVLLFLVVVLILAAFDRLPSQVSSWSSEAEQAERVAQTFAAAQQRLKNTANEDRVDALRELQSLQDLGADRLEAADQDIKRRQTEARARVLSGRSLFAAAATGDVDRITASYRAQYLELPLLEKANQLVEARRGNLSQQFRRQQLDVRIDAYNRDVEALDAKRARRDQLDQEAADQRRNPLCRRVAISGLCAKVRELRQLDEEIAGENRELAARRRALELEKQAALAVQRLSEEVGDISQLANRTLTQLASDTQQRTREASGYVWNQTKDVLREYSWPAFWIVIGALLMPVLFKLIAFYLLAPLASRAAPIRLARSGKPLEPGGSLTAVEVAIGPDEELLVRSSAQDRPAGGRGGSVMLLQWSMPFTCLAAGLVNLQRFRSDRPDHVTVTGTDEEHFEVSLLTIPAGGSVVLQPRALVGVRRRIADPLVIHRKWRLNRMASWLTFQFRYIVFEGPCTLIVQGRRGIRTGPATEGRAINKRLVLGFDAGLAYGAARSNSFRFYLFGRESLFDDRFAGIGRFIYEERSSAPARGGIWGRGIKGAGDAILKAFGI